MNAELIEETDNYNLYSIPAEVNGRETNLRAIYDYSAEEYRVLGTYDGVDGSGSMTSRGITPLQDGDEIVFLLLAWEADTDEDFWYYTDAVTWSDDVVMEDEDMGDGYYMYMFEIRGIFGTEYETAPVRRICLFAITVQILPEPRNTWRLPSRDLRRRRWLANLRRSRRMSLPPLRRGQARACRGWKSPCVTVAGKE